MVELQRARKAWSTAEDALLDKPEATVAKLTGRTIAGVRDRKNFLKGKRQPRKFPATHHCETDLGLKRLSHEAQKSILETRKTLRSLVKLKKIPDVRRKPGRNERDWERGWESEEDYQFVLKVVCREPSGK